ncbi:hypothetical protein PFAG_03300 [Plasmodium falciparum Santa Lucia]|uniref:Uncharacterized protein n=1 Tax=Plasmodium falciparum Santa Lucia TaxID=478859 RepID=W7FXG1_PLAFA|nr:hypothetical protein PFAG_03300 [Plasmodium falciparum Santa Lucia]
MKPTYVYGTELDIQNDTVSYQNFYDYNYLFNEYEDKFYLEIIIK